MFDEMKYDDVLLLLLRLEMSLLRHVFASFVFVFDVLLLFPLLLLAETSVVKHRS